MIYIEKVSDNTRQILVVIYNVINTITEIIREGKSEPRLFTLIKKGIKRGIGHVTGFHALVNFLAKV